MVLCRRLPLPPDYRKTANMNNTATIDNLTAYWHVSNTGEIPPLADNIRAKAQSE